MGGTGNWKTCPQRLSSALHTGLEYESLFVHRGPEEKPYQASLSFLDTSYGPTKSHNAPPPHTHTFSCSGSQHCPLKMQLLGAIPRCQSAELASLWPGACCLEVFEALPVICQLPQSC